MIPINDNLIIKVDKKNKTMKMGTSGRNIRSLVIGKIFVNKRIELANTLPSEFYTNEKFYNLTKEKIFLKSWQWIDNKGINKKIKL